MRVRSVAASLAFGYFFWVFARDGTLGRLINDASRGGQDFARGLRGPARLA